MKLRFSNWILSSALSIFRLAVPLKVSPARSDNWLRFFYTWATGGNSSVDIGLAEPSEFMSLSQMMYFYFLRLPKETSHLQKSQTCRRDQFFCLTMIWIHSFRLCYLQKIGHRPKSGDLFRKVLLSLSRLPKHWVGSTHIYHRCLIHWPTFRPLHFDSKNE